MKIVLITDFDVPELGQLRDIFSADQPISVMTAEDAVASNLDDIALAVIIVTRPDFQTRLARLVDYLKRRPWVSAVIAASEAISNSSDINRFTTVPVVSLSNVEAMASLPRTFENAAKNFVVSKISASAKRRVEVNVREASPRATTSSGTAGVTGSARQSKSKRPAPISYDVWLAKRAGYWLGAATTLLAAAELAWLFREELWSALTKVLPLAKSAVTSAPAPVGGPPTSGTSGTANPIVDAVDCSVFAKSNIPPSGTLLLRVSFHLRDQLEALQRKFGQDARATPSQLMGIPLCRGDELTVQFDGDEQITADEPVQCLTWQGIPETLQFKLKCNEQLEGKELLPLIKVWVNNRYIGRMVLELTCASSSDKIESAGICRAIQALEPIFVSYSRWDWPRAKHLAEDFEAVRLRPFIDVLRLRSGEAWEERLMREIDGCNSFCVIWSHAAKNSAWVKKEYQRAVERQATQKDRRPEIIVISKPSRRHLWERRSVPQPWEFAAKYHHSPLEIDLVHIHHD